MNGKEWPGEVIDELAQLGLVTVRRELLEALFNTYKAAFVFTRVDGTRNAAAIVLAKHQLDQQVQACTREMDRLKASATGGESSDGD